MSERFYIGLINALLISCCFWICAWLCVNGDVIGAIGWLIVAALVLKRAVRHG